MIFLVYIRRLCSFVRLNRQLGYMLMHAHFCREFIVNALACRSVPPTFKGKASYQLRARPKTAVVVTKQE